MQNESDKTSIKQLIQGMSGKGEQVLQGVVKSVEPLSIQIVNDDKLIISANSIIVPRHLTEHTLEVTPVDWVTEDASGGSGYAEYASHSHKIVKKAKLKVHNQLVVGDKLHILAFNNGKQYYLLDRVPEGE